MTEKTPERNHVAELEEQHHKDTERLKLALDRHGEMPDRMKAEIAMRQTHALERIAVAAYSAMGLASALAELKMTQLEELLARARGEPKKKLYANRDIKQGDLIYIQEDEAGDRWAFPAEPDSPEGKIYASYNIQAGHLLKLDKDAAGKRWARRIGEGDVQSGDRICASHDIKIGDPIYIRRDPAGNMWALRG